MTTTAFKTAWRALLHNDWQTVQRLLSDGMLSIDYRSGSDKWTLLHAALVSTVHQPTVEIVRHLIQSGADVNARDAESWTALHMASRLQSSELVKLLLDAGAEPDPFNAQEVTPLHLATLENPTNFAIVELLLSKGADPHRKRQLGCTVYELVSRVANNPDQGKILSLFDSYSSK